MSNVRTDCRGIFRKFSAVSCRAAFNLHNSSPEMIDPPYRTVAVASTFSPRFLKVLAEAKRVRDRLGQEMHLIFVGSRGDEKGQKFSEAFRELELPADSPIHYHEGDDPAAAILEAARENQVDLL